MTVRDALRALGWQFAPQVMADRQVRYQEQLAVDSGLREQAEQFAAATGGLVLRGPLAGASYRPSGDAAIAKLVGAYECEIHPWIDEWLTGPGRVFVDVGAGDGYYACGVKTVRPELRVIAFELAPIQRRRLAESAAEIEILGRATPRALADIPLERALVLVDVQGAEVDVLRGASLPALRSATVIVALHEHANPAALDLLSARFAPTHTVDIVVISHRDLAAFAELANHPDRAALIGERSRVDGYRLARFSPRAA
jgi:precorrin-6B methylase 2